MTALGGCWDWRRRAAAPACNAILDAQSRFGRFAAEQVDADEISIGQRPSRLLPEDGFGPAVVRLANGDLLCADIRLDDREGFADALGMAASELAAASDSALVGLAWQRSGRDCLERIVGDFALAHWDVARRELTLARDFSAQRPLHFVRRPGMLAWASMPSGLHALPDVGRRADLGDVAQFLDLAGEGDRRSFFADVEKVAPGSAIAFTKHGERRIRIWSPPTPIRLARDCDYSDALRERLDCAVKSRLRRSSGAVATHLSGGLDSGAVTATAARMADEVHAFTAVPGDGRQPSLAHELSDEGPLAAMVAARYPNIAHQLVRSVGGSPLDGRGEDFERFQRPVLNPVNFVWMKQILDRAREAGSSVLLTGARGNLGFSFSGETLLPALLRRGSLFRFGREAGAMLAAGVGTRRIAAASLLPLLPNRARSLLIGNVQRLRGRAVPSLLCTDALEKFGRADSNAPIPGWDSVALRIRGLTGVDYGNYHHGMLAGWGIDLRDPTSDRRLVDFCLAIPDDQFLRDGVPRNLARRVAAELLPPALLSERRRGYQAADWSVGLAGERDRVGREVERAAAHGELRRLLDVDRMRELVERWPKDWSDPSLRPSYRLALMRALSAADFVFRAS